MSRKGAAAAHGRGLKNEELLIKEIRQLLQQRNRNEELRVVTNAGTEDFEEWIKFLRLNVTAMIGPHGGAFYNHRFCSQDTLIIEINPSTRISMVTWEEASCRRLFHFF